MFLFCFLFRAGSLLCTDFCFRFSVFSFFLVWKLCYLKIDAFNNIVKQNIGVVNCHVTSARNNFYVQNVIEHSFSWSKS